jgi:hypothetical protein
LKSVGAPFFDLYIVRNFFDAEACGELIAAIRDSAATAALTYGKGDAAVDELVRRVSRASLSDEMLASVHPIFH